MCLESQLQRELDDASVRRTDDLAETRTDRNSGHTEIRVIQRIEEFRPELGGQPFPDCEVLGQIEVQVHKAWATQDADARVSENLVREEARPRRRSEGHKRIRVEPPVHGALGIRQSSVRDSIRAAAAFAAYVHGLRLIDGERKSGLRREDRRELPSAKKQVCPAGPVLAIGLTPAERQPP